MAAAHTFQQPATAAAYVGTTLNYGNVNGFEDIADTTEIRQREYLERDQALTIPYYRNNDAGWRNLVATADRRARIMGMLAPPNAQRMLLAGLNPDQAIVTGIGTSWLIVYLMHQLAAQPGMTWDELKALLFHVGEIVSGPSVGVPAADLVAQAGILGRIRVRDGGRYVSIPFAQDVINGLADRTIFTRGRTVSVGCLLIAKTMLFRTGHHVQTIDTHTAQMEKIAQATGLADALNTVGFNNDRGKLALCRVMVHPFRGSTVRLVAVLLEGTARRAIEVRLTGYGAGWARLNVFKAVVEACKTHPEYSIVLALYFGADNDAMVALANDTFNVNGRRIGAPGNVLANGRFCMVGDAFDQGLGGPLPETASKILERHATLFKAICEDHGGSLANQKTFDKFATNTRAIKEVINTVRDQLRTQVVIQTIVDAVAAGRYATGAGLEAETRRAIELPFLARLDPARFPPKYRAGPGAPPV